MQFRDAQIESSVTPAGGHVFGTMQANVLSIAGTVRLRQVHPKSLTVDTARIASVFSESDPPASSPNIGMKGFPPIFFSFHLAVLWHVALEKS